MNKEYSIGLAKKSLTGFSVRRYKQPKQPFWPTQHQHRFTFWGFPGSSVVKKPPAMQEPQETPV